MKRRWAGILLRGAIVGGTMLVPGVSGGSMAMALGIYGPLVRAVGSFGKHKGESAALIALFLAGALGGMALLAGPVMYLLKTWTAPTCYFFLGAVAGGLKPVIKKAGGLSGRALLWTALGLMAVLALAFLPGMRGGALAQGGALALALAGLPLAVALVLPGISVSYVLMLLGLYESALQAIQTLQWPFLLPLGLGLAAGVLLVTRALERALDVFPQCAYPFILGFVLGSLAQLFPGLPPPGQWIIALPPWLWAAWPSPGRPGARARPGAFDIAAPCRYNRLDKGRRSSWMNR